jgi:hypothetical protein
MNIRDLFGKALTFPTHENDDLHYIGEALPAPSLVAATLSTGTPASVGGSSVPAREDHVHALDLDDLIAAIEDGLVDLSNYYTKAEADALHDAIVAGEIDLSDYYTKDEIDIIIAALDYYTQSEVDALIAAIPSGGSGTQQLVWTWPGLYAPGANVTTPEIRIPFTGGGTLARVRILAGTSDDNYNIQVHINVDSVQIYSLLLVTTTTESEVAATSFSDDSIDDDDVPITLTFVALAAGSGEDITVILEYDPN